MSDFTKESFQFWLTKMPPFKRSTLAFLSLWIAENGYKITAQSRHLILVKDGQRSEVGYPDWMRRFLSFHKGPISPKCAIAFLESGL